MTQRLYLAYGSNLCKANMRRRCPDARAAGVIRLNDCRLIFRGVADVVPEVGQSVVCGLWKISRRDEEALDRYEGFFGGGRGAYAKRRVRINRDGSEAFLYVMTARGIYPPTQQYVDVIRRGYRDFGIDEARLDAAIEYSITGKDPCEMTLARRQRQIKAGQGPLVRMKGKGMGDEFVYRAKSSRPQVIAVRCVDCASTEEVPWSARATCSDFVCSICQGERKIWKRKA